MQAYCELLTKCRNTDRCDVRTPDQIGGTCNVMGDPPDRPNFGIKYVYADASPPPSPPP